MHRKNASATSTGRQKTEDQTENDINRRDALISIGKYAAYVTPAMTVLIRGDAALATHSCPNMNPPHPCISP